jgi:hypothetical protein
VGYLLFGVYPAFIIWTRKRRGFPFGLEFLFKRNFLITIFTSIIVIAPVVIDTIVLNGINPFLYQLGFYRVATVTATYVKPSGTNLVIAGFNLYIDTLIDRTSAATIAIPWLSIYEVVASFLLVVTVLYYIPPFLQAKPKESYIFISFIVFNLFVALFTKAHEWYLLWNLPLFLIMLSNMGVGLFYEWNSRGSRSFLGALRFIVLVSISVFVFSTLVVGMAAPALNSKGPTRGWEEATVYIIDNIRPGESIAAKDFEIMTFYFDKYNFQMQEQNIQILGLFKIDKTIGGKSYVEVNFEMLDLLKPRYIVETEYIYYSYINNIDDLKIREDYTLILKAGDERYKVLLFERKQTPSGTVSEY